MRPTVLNIVGIIVILLGIGIACAVYRSGHAGSESQAAADGDWHDDTLSLEDSKSSTHDVEMYGGPLEMLMVKFNEALAQPGSQAALIVVASALVALGCFAAARRSPGPSSDHDVS